MYYLNTTKKGKVDVSSHLGRFGLFECCCVCEPIAQKEGMHSQAPVGPLCKFLAQKGP